MKIKMKTVKEMKETEGIYEIHDALRGEKDFCAFLLNCPMETNLCGKEFKVEETNEPSTEEYPYAVRVGQETMLWYIPWFAVKEVLED